MSDNGLTRRGAVALTAAAAASPAFAAGADGTAKIDVSRYRSAKGFGAAYIDKDEWRDKPVRHRYVHGGFKGDHTRFSFYLPPGDKYRGRLLQFLEGGSGGNETVLTAADFQSAPWQFLLAHDELGACLIESNQGHFAYEGSGFINPVYLYGASAEVARLCKWVAARLYGAPVTRSYVYGSSGGGHRTIQCVMNAPDVYDGGVPEVVGVSPGLYWSAFGNLLEVIGPQRGGVIDALEVGGGGDPFAGLNAEQRAALADVLSLGYPIRAASQMYRLGPFPFSMYRAMEGDPDYFKDFWTKTGYLGHDNPQALAARRVEVKTTFKQVFTVKDVKGGAAQMLFRSLVSAGAASPTSVGAILDVPDQNRLFMSRLTVLSGKAKGRQMVISNVIDGIAVPFPQYAPEMFNDVAAGDEVQIDNRDWVAYTQYYRHTVRANTPDLKGPGGGVIPEYSGFAMNGAPIWPQAKGASYDLDHLKPFPGKMIMIGCLADVYIWPTKITPMDRMMRQTLGANAENQWRLWWVENATHGPPVLATFSNPEKRLTVWNTRLVDYDGACAQAIRALRAWVEDGQAPAPSSAYALSRDNQVVLPLTPDRGGVQPIVRATVNGGLRAEVRVGQSVTLEGVAEAVPGGGGFVFAAWDPDHSDAWPYKSDASDGTATSLRLTATHAFDKPGTYFPSFRVATHTQGKAGVQPIANLARVRVVVTA